MKIFSKKSTGKHEIITIFGFIKIKYRPKFFKKSIKIIDNGYNNIINDNKPFSLKNSGKLTFIFNGNNNRVYLGENLNKMVNTGSYNGNVTFTFNGNNNTVYLGDDTSFNDSNFRFWRDNVTLSIGKNCNIIQTTAELSGYKDGVKVSIGNNFCNSSTMELYAGGGKNMDLTIGNDCMFSRDIVIYAHDGHNIYDKDSKEVINNPKNSVVIGNHVWLGHGSIVLKNSVLPDNSIIGAKSVVSKVFNEEYTIIAGNPAKIVKRKVYFIK